MIKCIIFDIDGVITSGTVIVDESGNENKVINMKDIDAVYELKKDGYIIVAMTGESEEKSKYFKNRFPWDKFYANEKNKDKRIIELKDKLHLELEEICYVGDGKYDVEALKIVGLSICPRNAIQEVKNVSKVILRNNSGEGIIWKVKEYIYEMEKEESYFEKKIKKNINEHIKIFKDIYNEKKMITQLEEISNSIYNALIGNKKVIIFGNGGSAADAQHIAAEFVGRFKYERKAMNVEALTTNTSILTSIGNDYTFDKIFTRQLEAKVSKGDIIIGITTTGTSKNIIDALDYAKKEGGITVLLTGELVQNQVDNEYNYIINVPSKDTPRIQEAHIFIGHMIAEYVEKIIASKG